MTLMNLSTLNSFNEVDAVLAAARVTLDKMLSSWLHGQALSPASRLSAARAAAALEVSGWREAGHTYPSRPQAMYTLGTLLLLSAPLSSTALAGSDRRRAVELLEASVKLSPSLVAAWNVLAAMHSEAGQLVLAVHCVASGLASSVSVEGLRQMSMCLRRLAANTGASPHERQEAVAASLAAAKQAVAMDVKDGFSWYVLGMAHVASSSPAPPTAAAAPAAAAVTDVLIEDADKSDQFHKHWQHQGQSEKQLVVAACSNSTVAEAAAAAAWSALSAFTAAERAGLTGLPELWFNRAAVALHLGEFEQALQDFSKAAQLDATLPTASQISAIQQLLVALAGHMESSTAGLQPNQAAALQVALQHDLSAGLPQKLLPSGWHVVTLQQQLQVSLAGSQAAGVLQCSSNSRSRSKYISSNHSSNRRFSNKTSSNSSAGSSSADSSSSSVTSSNRVQLGPRDAVHCRIAAVLERLPGCGQWVCVAMLPCGSVFPLLLPGSVAIQRVLGVCLLLLWPSISSLAVRGEDNIKHGKGKQLVMVRVHRAADVLTAGSDSSSSLGSPAAQGSSTCSQMDIRQYDVSLHTTLL